MTTDGLRGRLSEAIEAGDRSGAVDMALGAVAAGELTIPTLYATLGTLLTDLGEKWRRGDLEVWQEHLASAVVRTVVEALHPTVRRLSAPTNGRSVVLACPENESHDLGIRMLADRFELAGWQVVYLGADVPASEIAAAARAVGAELVMLSVSTHYHRMRARQALDVLANEAPGIRVMLGGPAFRDEPDAGSASTSELAALLGEGEPTPSAPKAG